MIIFSLYLQQLAAYTLVNFSGRSFISPPPEIVQRFIKGKGWAISQYRFSQGLNLKDVQNSNFFYDVVVLYAVSRHMGGGPVPSSMLFPDSCLKILRNPPSKAKANAIQRDIMALPLTTLHRYFTNDVSNVVAEKLYDVSTVAGLPTGDLYHHV